MERICGGIGAVWQVEEEVGAEVARGFLPQDDQPVGNTQSEFASETVASGGQAVEVFARDGSIDCFEVPVLGVECGFPVRLERTQCQRSGRFGFGAGEGSGGFEEIAGCGHRET